MKKYLVNFLLLLTMTLFLGAVDIATKSIMKQRANELIAEHPNTMESISLTQQGKILYSNLPTESKEIFDYMKSYSKKASYIKNIAKLFVLLFFSFIIVSVNRRLA